MTVNKIHKKLLDHLKTGVILLDENLQLTFLNLAAEQIFEISERKALSSRLDELLVGAEEDLLEIREAIASGSSFTKREARLRLSHGKRIEVDYTVNVFEDEQGKQVLLELDSLEHAYRINREESANSTHTTTRELVRGLAHEIKNPLGGIRGAAQLLAAELPNRELNALEHDACELSAFALRPAAQQHMKTRRHRHSELHLIFAGQGLHPNGLQ